MMIPTSKSIIHITFPVPKKGFEGDPKYPVCVRIDDGQETLCRSVREARIYSHGLQWGLQIGLRVFPKIEIDPRMVDSPDP